MSWVSGVCFGVVAVLAVGCASSPARGLNGSPAASSLPGAARSRAREAGWTVVEGDARIRVRVEPNGYAFEPLESGALIRWVRGAASMVHAYWGRFPVADLEVRVVLQPGEVVGFGLHTQGRRVRIQVGRNTSRETLRRDWVLLHEMIHTAFPEVGRRHRWMTEGLSTYLESVLMARSGRLSEREVWGRWVERMPYGGAHPGDAGLDHTDAWGRVYWGGALFWLLADVRLRVQTGNEDALRAALRTLVARGGNARARWSVEQVLVVLDAATGTTVLRDLYDEMASRPTRVDLDQLWGQLGVVVRGGRVVRFREDAPLAAVRRGMLSEVSAALSSSELALGAR